MAQAVAPDDGMLTVSQNDFSGGMNTRRHASRIAQNQAEDLTNADIGVAGETRKRLGLTLIENLEGTNGGTCAFGFEPDGGTNELLVTHDQKLEGWTGSGTFTEHKTDFTTNLATTIIKAGESGEGDVVLISNGTDNVFRMLQAHTFQDCLDTNTSPPKTTVMTYFRNRVWALKSNLLYFSDAYPADYSAAFDRTTDAFRVPIGTERSILGLRDAGMVMVGSEQIWGLNPSIIPDPTTDKPEKILDIGCVANKTVCQVGDDVLFLASDGVRGVFRTQQDKLQLGQSFPLSYNLKTQFEDINWSYITKACAIHFDNKYLLSLPTASSAYNNTVWIYYPALQAWTVIDGWNVSSFASLTVGGEERLYATSATDGKVYRCLFGDNDNGTAITMTIIGREENYGQPLVKKNGGEIEIEAEVAGSDNKFTLSVAQDGGSFQSLDDISLDSETAPTLPIALPFALADSYVVREKQSLDSLGAYRTIQIKIENSDDNTDPIILYGYNLIAFKEEYENG